MIGGVMTPASPDSRQVNQKDHPLLNEPTGDA